MEKQQVNMHQILAQKQELEAAYFEQRMNSEMFPTEKLSKLWRETVKASMYHVMPVMLRVSLKEFKSVLECLPRLDKGEPISLFEFGVLSNSVENVTLRDLKIDGGKYIEFVEEALEHVEYWHKRNSIIRADVQKRAENDMKMKAMALANKNPLKPVVGEA